MNHSQIMLVEPPSVSVYGNQRIFGGNGSNKSDFRKPPLDLMMISGYLRKEGYDNTLLDANASRMRLRDVKEIMQASSPAVVFLSTSTCTIKEDLLVAKVAKEVNRSAVTVAVGTHAMALPMETFQASEHLDALVYSSEWEQASLNIVENVSNLDLAKGIYHRNGSNGIVKTEDQLPVDPLDDLGFPSHDKLEQRIYDDPTAKRLPKTMVMGQKACINSCSFCCQPAFFGAPRLRKRSVSHFIEEMKWVQKLGFREVMFNDATLTADMDWASDLFEKMITHHIDLTWNCSTRADRIHPAILKLMKRAGCHTIAIGMESTDPAILKNIKKNITPEQVREAVSWIRREGLDTIVFCVIGFPGETKETITKTISFLKKLDTTFITLGIAVPVPGTEFFRYIEENKYLLTKDWSQYDPMKKAVFSYPWLSAEDLAYYSAFGLRQFYLRPRYILKQLCSMRSYTEFKSTLKNFIGFINRYVRSPKVEDV